MLKRAYRSMWMGVLLAGGLLPCVQAELVASWRFDDATSPLKATVGEDAVVGYAAGKGSNVQSGMGATYLLSAPPASDTYAAGAASKLMPGDGAIAIPKSSHLRLPIPKSRLAYHNWTIRTRFFVPASADGVFHAFFERNANNNDNDADLFIRSQRSGSTSKRIGGGWMGSFAQGSSGYNGPEVSAGVWHTLIIAQGNARCTAWLDGKAINYRNGATSGIDFFSGCTADFLLWSADGDGDDGLTYFSQIDIFDEAVDPEMGELNISVPKPTGEWRFPKGNVLKGHIGPDLEKFTNSGKAVNFQEIDGPVPGSAALRCGTYNCLKCVHGTKPGGSYTMVLDVRIPRTSDLGGYHAYLWNGGSSDAIAFYYKNATDLLEIWFRSGKRNTNGGLYVDQWARIVLATGPTSVGGHKYLYVNGKQVEETAYNTAALSLLSNSVCYLLGDNDGEDHTIDISYAAFYDVQLSHEQIAKNFARPISYDANENMIPSHAPTGVWTPTGTEELGTSAETTFGVPFVAEENGYSTTRGAAPASETSTMLFDVKLPADRAQGFMLYGNTTGEYVGIYNSASSLNGSIFATTTPATWETSGWANNLFGYWTYESIPRDDEFHRVAIVRNAGSNMAQYFIDGLWRAHVNEYDGTKGTWLRPTRVMKYLQNVGANVSRVVTYDVNLLPAEIARLGSLAAPPLTPSEVAPTVGVSISNDVTEVDAVLETVTFVVPYELGVVNGSVSIDYGDGTGDVRPALTGTGTLTFSHVYSVAGEMTVTVRAIDPSFTTGTATTSITVKAVDITSDAVLTEMPWLQNVYTNRFSVMCEAAQDYPGLQLQWGEDFANTTPFTSEIAATGRYIFTARVTVENQEGAEIPCRLAMNGLPLTGTSTARTVKLWSNETNPNGFTAVVWGDNQQGGLAGDWDADKFAYVTSIFNHMLTRNPDFGISTGDMASSADYANQISPLILQRTNRILGQQVPYYVAFGNHDTSYLENRKYFSNPSENDPAYGTPGEGNFYLYRDNVLMVFLDNKIYTSTDTQTWLANVLGSERAQAAKFRLVFVHVPVYLELWGGNNNTTLKAIYNQYHVDAVFSGHMHGYERIEGAEDTFVQLTNGCVGYLDRIEQVQANYGDQTKVGGHNDMPYLWARQALDGSGLGLAEPVRAGLVQSYGELQVKGDVLTYRAHAFNADGSYIGVCDSVTLKARVTGTGGMVPHTAEAAVEVPSGAVPANLIDASAFVTVGAAGVTSTHGTLGGPVQLASAPITKAQWAAFEAARGNTVEVPAEEANAPACGMTRYEAEAFIAWVNGETETYRLPTEAELATLFFYDGEQEKWNRSCPAGAVSEWTSSVDPVHGWCCIMGGNARAVPGTWTRLFDHPCIASPGCSADYLGFRLAKVEGTVPEPQPGAGGMTTDFQGNLVLQGRMEGGTVTSGTGLEVKANGTVTFRSLQLIAGGMHVVSSDRLLHLAGDNDCSLADFYINGTSVTGIVCAAGVSSASITVKSIWQDAINRFFVVGPGVTLRTVGDFTSPGTDSSATPTAPIMVDGVCEIGGIYRTMADNWAHVLGEGDLRVGGLMWYRNIWLAFGTRSLTFTTANPVTGIYKRDRSRFHSYRTPLVLRGTVDWTINNRDYTGQPIWMSAEVANVGWCVDTLDPDDGVTAHTFTLRPEVFENSQTLTKINPGTLRIGGFSYTYTGATRVEGGSLVFLPGTSLTASPVTVMADGTLGIEGSVSFTKPVTFDGGTFAPADGACLRATAAGPFRFQQTTDATLQVPYTSSFSGAVTLAEGTSKFRFTYLFEGSNPLGEHLVMRGTGLTAEQVELVGTDLPEDTPFAVKTLVNAAGDVILQVTEKGTKVATWVGPAAGDLSAAANWSVLDAAGEPLPGAVPDAETYVRIAGETTFNLAAGASLAYKGIFLVDGAKLTTDCDWSGIEFSQLRTCGILDLNGHNLTLNWAFGSATASEITDSTPATALQKGGELHVVVPAGAIATNNLVKLTGSLAFFKDGAGTFRAQVGPQTYTGGTEITAGKAVAGVAGSAHPWGDVTGPITIDADATFDINGTTDHRQYDEMILAGGNLGNWGGNVAEGYGCNGRTRLTADSTLTVVGDLGFWGLVDLGGHTLTVPITSGRNLTLWGKDLATPGSFTNGLVNITSGGWFRISAGGPELNMGTVDFRFNCALNIARDISVRNLEQVYSSSSYALGSGLVKIFGVYTPTSNYVRNFVLQDGATINLEGKTDAWTLPKATGSCTDLLFADGAKIGLAFGTRKLGTFEKVLAWPADNPPANIEKIGFRLVDRGGSLKRREDGIYFMSGLTLILR